MFIVHLPSVADSYNHVTPPSVAVLEPCDGPVPEPWEVPATVHLYNLLFTNTLSFTLYAVLCAQVLPFIWVGISAVEVNSNISSASIVGVSGSESSKYACSVAQLATIL